MSLLDGYTEEQPKQYKKKKIDEPETTSLLDGYVEPEQQPSLVNNVLQGGVDIIQSLPEATKTFGQGLALGNHRIGSGLGDVLAFAGDKYNIPTLSDYGRTVNEYWGNRANNIEMNPEYEQIKNITNPKMTLPVIANAIGSQGANMAQSLMGGVLGTAMTGGNPVGGIAGSLMPNLILEGSYLDKVREFQEKYNRIPTQEELIKIQNVSLAEKGLNSAIETVADKLLFNKFFPNNPVQQGAKELAKRIGKGIIEQGLTEGITEGMQEGVSVGAEKLLNLNDQNLKENLGRIGNSAGMGAIGGAFFGGTGGALAQQPVQTQQEQTRVNPVDYAKEVSAKVLDGGRELYNNAVNQPTAFDMMKELSNNGNYSNIRELAPNIANKQEKTNNDSLLKGFKENAEQNNDTANKEVEQPSDTVKLSNEELLKKYQEQVKNDEIVNTNKVVDSESNTNSNLTINNLQKDKENYLKTIENVKNGNTKTGSRIEVLSETPKIWQEHGLPNKKVIIKKETFKKAGNLPNRKKVNHDVGDNVLNNLPELLQEPNYILKSSTEENSFVGVLNANDKQGYPVVVAIKPTKDSLQVNLIQSVYGRENYNNWIEKQSDNILYKKEISPQTTLSYEQKLGQGSKDIPNNIITNNSENLNPVVEKIAPKTAEKLTKKQELDEKIQKAKDYASQDKFIPNSQKTSMIDSLRGEEKEYFANKLLEVQEIVENAPQLYATEHIKENEKKPIMHYFGGSFDFYALEIDKETGEMFGLGGFNDELEYGYNTVENFNESPIFNLDLYYDNSQTISNIKGETLEKSNEIVNNNTSESEVNNGYNERTVLQSSRMAESEQGSNEKSSGTSRGQSETSRSIPEIRRSDNTGLDRGRLIPEHKEIIEKTYTNQNELNNAIEKFIKDKEYEKYDVLPDEIKTWLKKFTGAGGLEKQGAKGKGLLSEYYTPENIVKKMWDLTAQYINTDGASVLEPSVGIGRFLEFAPKNTTFDVVEMNPISAKITELLYPNANVKVGKFQERFIKDNKPVKSVEPEYDIVIGNPPYGAYADINKGKGEGKEHEQLETYFIDRALDLTKENGIVTFIVPSSVLKGGINPAKQNISKKAELLKAYRLPEKTFSTTSIGTDIIVLRKKSNNENRNIFWNDRYFEQNPENILGTVEKRLNRRKQEETFVKGDKNAVDNIIISEEDKDIMETETVIEKHIEVKESKSKGKRKNKNNNEEIKYLKSGEFEEYKPDIEMSKEDLKYYADTRVDGTLPQDKYQPSEKVNAYKGELYNDFNYLKGDIYEKLDQLENENISDKQKEIQRNKLLKVLPPPKKISEIYLTPTSDFINDFKITRKIKEWGSDLPVDKELPINYFYKEYVRELTNKERNGIAVKYIMEFINGESIRTPYKGYNLTETEKKNQQIDFITNLKNIVDKTFNDFVSISLTAEEIENLQNIWNRNFNAIYTPDFKKIPMLIKGLNATFYGEKLKLQDVQVEGVNYLTNQGVGLLGFEVGVGKTLSGTIATVQNMQLGRCKRPLIIVPKSVKPNWIREVHEAFPSIKINDADNLSKFDGKVEDGTITIATYQALDNIWYSDSTVEELKNDTKKIRTDYEKEATLTERGKEKGAEKNEEFIGKALAGNKELFTFEELGFDHITVDEAHNFKNLFGSSKAQFNNHKSDNKEGNAYKNITGAESKRAKQLFLATQYILKNNNNRNVFMLTATPFNNSPLEVFNMLSYIAKDKLDKMGLYNVYQFMENYVDIGADWVVSSTNEVAFKQIAKGFKNLGSLQSIIDSCMLMRSADDAGIVRPNKTTKHFALNPTNYQKKLIAKCEALAVGIEIQDDGSFRFLSKEERKGIQLKAISEARVATLSPDIYEKNDDVSPEDFIKNSPKLNFIMQAIDKMKKRDSKTSQILYMPIGVEFLPKIKQYLVNKKIYKADEIEIIQGGIKDDKLSYITDSFNDREGKVKLIIGTNKIKEGMNLNKNSSVLYVPFIDWNPTDYVQVVGRIWRRGNAYKDIRIIVPTLNDSSDSFMYQKLDEKTSRINSIMDRGKDYIDTGELNVAEEKINMITDPDKKARMFSQIEEQKLDNKVSEIEGQLQDTRFYIRELSNTESEIKRLQGYIDEYKKELSEIEDKESWQYTSKKSSLENKMKQLRTSKAHLEALNGKIKRLELDFNGKDSIENLTKQLEDIKKQKEDLQKTTELKKQEYQKEYERNRKTGKSIEDYVSEFDEDTVNLYGDIDKYLNNNKLNHIGKKTDVFVSETRAKEVQELLAPAVEKLSKVMGIPAETLKQEVMPKVDENAEDKAGDKLYSKDKRTVKPINIEMGSVPSLSTVPDIKEWIINNIDLIGDIQVKSNGRIIKFSKGNIDRSMKDVGRNNVRRESYSKLKELVENSFHNDYDIKQADKEHKNISHQELYYNAFIYNGQTYGIEISVDIPKEEIKIKYPDTATNNYAGHKVKVIKIEPSALGADQKGTSNSKGSNISITDIQQLFNPPSENKGAYSTKENLIEFFKNADSSTSVHEVGHWILNTWNKYAPLNKEIEADVNAIRKFVGNKGEEFTQEQHEKFASGFETYIRNGKAKTSKLQEVFGKFKRALRAIYRSLKDIVFKQNNKDTYFTKDDMQDINDLFNRIFTTEKDRKYMGIEDVEVENIKPTNKGQTPDKLYQGIGLSGVKRANENLTPSQKAQKTRKENLEKAKKLESADDKQVKEYVRQWYASIESDRYDVNKTLNSFINISNNIAKEYSKKYGQKVTGKMVREIMPFLRERTDIPENLNRPELIKLFNSLDKTQKDRLRKLADDTSSKFDKYYQTYKKLKGSLTEQDIENHISHIWKKTEKDLPLLTNYFATRSRFAKERKVPTIFDGINGIELENGETKYYEPQTLDYAEILKITSDTFIKSNSDIILADLVKNMKNEDGTPLVLPSNKAPSNWVELDNPALAKRVYIGSDEKTTTLEKQNVKVHPDIANTLKTVFETHKDNKYITGFDKLNSLYKQAQLGFSGFHIVALSESMLGNMGIKKTLKFLNPARIFDEVSKGNWNIYKDDTLAHQAIDDGLQFGSTLDIDRGTVEKIVDNIAEWTEKIPFIGKSLAYAPKTLSSLQKLNNKILWDYLHNNYKLECYKLLCIQEAERKMSPLTQEERREIAHWVNDSFGGQVWENLGITNTGRKTEQRIFLSPDWLRSTTRQFLAMFSNKKLSIILRDKAETSKFWKQAKELGERWGIGSLTDDVQSSSLRGSISRRFWLRSMIYSALLYNVLNALMRMWDKEKHPEYYQNGMTAKDFSIYSNGLPNDKPMDKFLPRVFAGRNKDGSEKMLRLGKQFREVPEILEDPIKKIGGKLSPNIQLGSQIFTGHTASVFKNYEMFNKDGTKKPVISVASAKVVAKSFVPFSVNSMMTKDKDPSVWSLVAPVSKGMTKTKGRIAYENIYKNGGNQEQIQMVDKAMLRNGFTQKEIKNQKKNARKNFVDSHYEKYLKAIETQNDNKIQSARQELVKSKLTPKEINNLHKKAFKEYMKEIMKNS